MSERDAPRVVLLARAGDARDRLGEALAQAGAEVALVADPASGDPREAVDSHPQAVLVALEPAVEAALERYDALLSDPAIAVIFEEAELAAQRTGWDAARWVRHLSAKLHRHDDVLPPGADEEGDLQPSPGALPPPRAAGGLDIAPFAEQAQALAGEVPRDEGLEPEVRLEPEAADALSLADDAPAEAAPEPEYDVAGELPPAAEDPGLDAEDLSGLSEDSLTFEAVVDDDAGSGLSGDDADASLEMASWDAGDGAHADNDVELVDVDALLASMQAGGSDGDAVADESPDAVSSDDAPAPPSPPRTAAEIDLDALEARVSSLSLADVDSYGHGPERGAVLVEGGLGGPDAVRQLLAAIPEGFPRPVLVRLQLDGGRYDRLVKQMARAAQVPVALAEAGHAAEAGTVYFIPPDISLERDRSRLVFVADESRSKPLLDALPPADSALLLLSGSSVDSVGAGMAQVASGLLVAGQALDGCYDPAASTALIAHGAATAMPAELAGQLAARWPS
ncbi:chemotaxis protein CheB [Luteimonas lutimaris]|uniref:CheB-type methylesterase domain-containing protein n=1 Tax=Luteimonas lutimaris TaxID=698645 RepID=A0ABP7MAE2_9GAMM